MATTAKPSTSKHFSDRVFKRSEGSFTVSHIVAIPFPLYGCNSVSFCSVNLAMLSYQAREKYPLGGNTYGYYEISKQILYAVVPKQFFGRFFLVGQRVLLQPLA